MKTLLRELGAALIMLSAFMVCHAQQAPQFVGLPEYGVTLGGDANNPTIINTSGRGILGHVIILRDVKGGWPNGSGMIPNTIGA